MKILMILIIAALHVHPGIIGANADDAKPADISADREASLLAFVRQLYSDMENPDEALRREALIRALPTKDDLFALLPTADAERLWPHMNKRLEKVIQSAPLMKGWQRDKMYLNNIISEIQIIDIHRSAEWRETASDFLELINKQVPIYWVITHRDPDNAKRIAESGPYFLIDSRWRWIPDFHRVRAIILRLRRKAGVETAEPEDVFDE